VVYLQLFAFSHYCIDSSFISVTFLFDFNRHFEA
jgi:hypothetical protein